MSVLHVIFKVGDGDYALPASEVLQMEPYEGATHVPGAPHFVAGIIQVRGRVVPIVDLRVRFGLAPRPPSVDTRVVVVQLGDRTVGLLVDLAREVVMLEEKQVQPPPRIVSEGASGFVRAVAHEGKRMLMLVDAAKVIGEEPIHVS